MITLWLSIIDTVLNSQLSSLQTNPVRVTAATAVSNSAVVNCIHNHKCSNQALEIPESLYLKNAMHSAALCRTSASEILDLWKKLSYDIFGLTYLELIVYLKLITVDIFSYIWCFDYIG